MRRRAVLGAVGAAGAASLTGCSSLLRSEETLVDESYAFNTPQTWRLDAEAGDLLSVRRGTNAQGFFNKGAAAYALYRRDDASSVTLLAARPGERGTYGEDGWLHAEVPDAGTYEFHLLNAYRHVRSGTGTFEGAGEPAEEGHLTIKRTTHHGRSDLDDPYRGGVTDALFGLMEYDGLPRLWPQNQEDEDRHTVYSGATIGAEVTATTHPLQVRWLEYLGNEWLVPAGSDRLREAEQLYSDAIPYIHSNAAVAAAKQRSYDLEDQIHEFVAELVVRKAGLDEEYAADSVERYLDEHVGLSFEFATVQQSDRPKGTIRNVVRLTAARTFTIDWTEIAALNGYPDLEVDLELPVVFPVDTTLSGPVVVVEDIDHTIVTSAVTLLLAELE